MPSSLSPISSLLHLNLPYQSMCYIHFRRKTTYLRTECGFFMKVSMPEFTIFSRRNDTFSLYTNTAWSACNLAVYVFVFYSVWSCARFCADLKKWSFTQTQRTLNFTHMYVVQCRKLPFFQLFRVVLFLYL